MARLGKTIRILSKMRAMPQMPSAVGGRLRELVDFGSNPGALRAYYYTPESLPENAPLVVVLHGCTQNAAGYDHGAGWSQLADELGFAVLVPEQQRANNFNLCFNWYATGDARRDRGEALSIRQMIASMVATHRLDASRVFVTGLSAGGAMTSVMLAAYPEVFAGGAIIAGLPFGCAGSLGEAFAGMSGQGYPSDEQLGALVRGASTHQGPWPSISIWQGGADAIVAPSNAERILGQWRTVHGLPNTLGEIGSVAGSEHRLWGNAAGRVVIETHLIAGMGHGTPVRTRGPGSCGVAGPYMLEHEVSSTRAIARSWGLGDKVGARQRALPAGPIVATAQAPPRPERAALLPSPLPKAHTPSSTGVGAIIEDALRAAGLMR